MAKSKQEILNDIINGMSSGVDQSTNSLEALMKSDILKLVQTIVNSQEDLSSTIGKLSDDLRGAAKGSASYNPQAEKMMNDFATKISTLGTVLTKLDRSVSQNVATSVGNQLFGLDNAALNRLTARIDQSRNPSQTYQYDIYRARAETISRNPYLGSYARVNGESPVNYLNQSERLNYGYGQARFGKEMSNTYSGLQGNKHSREADQLLRESGFGENTNFANDFKISAMGSLKEIAEVVSSLNVELANLGKELSQSGDEVKSDEIKQKILEKKKAIVELNSGAASIAEELTAYDRNTKNIRTDSYKGLGRVASGFGENMFNKYAGASGNPFPALFMDSLKTGIQVGSQVSSLTSNLLGAGKGGGGLGLDALIAGAAGIASKGAKFIIPFLSRAVPWLKAGAAGVTAFTLPFMGTAGGDMADQQMTQQDVDYWKKISNTNKTSQYPVKIPDNVQNILSGKLTLADANKAILTSKNNDNKTNDLNKSLEKFASTVNMSKDQLLKLGSAAGLSAVAMGALLATGGGINTLKSIIAGGAGVLAGGIAAAGNFYMGAIQQGAGAYEGYYNSAKLLNYNQRQSLGGNALSIAQAGTNTGLYGLGFSPEEVTGLRALGQRSGFGLGNNADITSAAYTGRALGLGAEEVMNSQAMMTRLGLRGTAYGAYAALGSSQEGKVTGLSKTFADGFIQAAKQLSLQGGLSEGANKALSIFGMTQNILKGAGGNLGLLAASNPEIAVQTVSGLSDYVKSGFTNMGAYGRLRRAGFSLEDMYKGITNPEQETRLLTQLGKEMNLGKYMIGGKISGDGREALAINLRQSGINVPFDAAVALLEGNASGKNQNALSKFYNQVNQGTPGSQASIDTKFEGYKGANLQAYLQGLVPTFKANIEYLTKFNVALTDLGTTALRVGDAIVPAVFKQMTDALAVIGINVDNPYALGANTPMPLKLSSNPQINNKPSLSAGNTGANTGALAGTLIGTGQTINSSNNHRTIFVVNGDVQVLDESKLGNK